MYDHVMGWTWHTTKNGRPLVIWLASINIHWLLPPWCKWSNISIFIKHWMTWKPALALHYCTPKVQTVTQHKMSHKKRLRCLPLAQHWMLSSSIPIISNLTSGKDDNASIKPKWNSSCNQSCIVHSTKSNFKQWWKQPLPIMMLTPTLFPTLKWCNPCATYGLLLFPSIFSICQLYIVITPMHHFCMICNIDLNCSFFQLTLSLCIVRYVITNHFSFLIDLCCHSMLLITYWQLILTT